MGPNGTAASAIFWPLFLFADFIGLMCGVGGSVLYAKAKGNGDKIKANKYFTTSLILVSVLTCIVRTLLFFFQDNLYILFGADSILLPYVQEYGRLIVYAFPAFVFSAFLPNFLSNDGVPNLNIIACVAGAIINITCDYVFVFPMQMGMYGAALSTILGAILQVLIMFSHLLSKRNTLKFNKPQNVFIEFINILKSGFAAAFSSLAIVIVSLVVNNQIMRYSDASVLAIYGMINTISALTLHVYNGIGQAAQPIISSAYGANKTDRCWGAYKLAIKTIIYVSILFTLICLLFPNHITALFIKPTPEIMEKGPLILKIYSMCFIPMGISVFISIFLQSITKPIPASIISFLRGFVIVCILLFFLPLIMGVRGIWAAFVLSEISVSLYALIRVLLYKKKENNVVIEIEEFNE